MSGELRCAHCGFVEKSWIKGFPPDECISMADHLDQCLPAIHYKTMAKCGLKQQIDETIAKKKKKKRYDELYMDIAKRVAEMSYAVRAKVGCVFVKDNNILSFGFNGMPAKMDNTCEHYEDAGMMGGTLVTNPEVSHAEENGLCKISRSTQSSLGATVYVTLEPCMHCAKLLYSSGIARVVYAEEYRNHDGVEYLKNRGIEVEKL